MELLDKTFDLLEYVLLQNGRPVTPSEASESSGVPLSTATRILCDLTARGYLDKISRKSGYAPGPLVAALANRDNIYHRLALAANEPVRKLAALTLCPVNLSVWRGEKRIMLVYSGPSPYWKPWGALQFADHDTTATGRLLLASLPENEQRKLYPSLHFNGWPEVSSEESFIAVCAKLKKDGFIRFSGVQQKAIIGHLIRVPDHPAAAIGFGTPDWNRCEEFFRASADAAREIGFNLKRNFHLF
jgi:DNA-binding IclR family transcriptional regulator